MSIMKIGLMRKVILQKTVINSNSKMLKLFISSNSNKLDLIYEGNFSGQLKLLKQVSLSSTIFSLTGMVIIYIYIIIIKFD